MKPAPTRRPAEVESPTGHRAAFLASLDTNAALLDKRGNIVAVNDAWTRFGRDNGGLLPSITVGVNYVDVCRRSAADCPEAGSILDGLLSVLSGASPIFRCEYRCDAPEISRWFLLTVTPWRSPEGGALASHMDISEYKVSAELQRRTLESIRAVVWTADVPTFRTTFVSGQVEEILGFPVHAWLNDQDLWKNRIHPDDRGWVLRDSSKAVEEGRNYEFDYRMLAADGHTAWLRQVVNVVRKPGCPVYLVGISIDVTELHRTREERQALSGRLLMAQEQERARIARELHDDFSQRVALIALHLEDLAKRYSTSPEKEDRQLREAIDSLSNLGTDLHTLSHRLHSAKLESLGLIPAVSALCREFTAQHGFEIDFSSDDTPGSVHPDTALCIFRIVQEGLRNLKKHSGAQQAFVILQLDGGKLLVRVLDKGCGFDMKDVTKKKGIGIQSMEERVRLLGGEFSIQSAPGKGTTVNAWLPLAPNRLDAW
ncbi:MAG: PAS domain-containing protein [Candidatus Acidiferrum sp.]